MHKKGLCLLLIFMSAALFALPTFNAESNRVLFINVGDADAALVSAYGQTALIDTGSRQSVPVLLAALRQMGVKRLNAVFLTHSHGDHVGGLAALKQAVPVDAVYIASIGETDRKGRGKTLAAAEKAGFAPASLNAGDTVRLGEMSLSVLGPLTLNMADDNDNSLVLKTVIDGQRYLFTGDMQFAEEESLLKSGADVGADVLKVGNHGNPDATGEAFARAVSPALAVISADTTADHDSANPRVMRALSRAQVRVTQQAALGLEVSMREEGLTVAYLPLPEPTLSGIVLSVDKENQRVTLSGRGDVSGAVLLSQRGGEAFVFPPGTRLDGTLRVSALGEQGSLVWQAQKPLHPTKEDAVALYDAGGNLVAQGR